MNTHFKSFIFSIVVHSMLLATIFYVYTKASTYYEKPKIQKQKEKRICIELGAIQEIVTPTQVVKKKKSPPSVKKKVEKKIPKRKIKKKIKHKKVKKHFKKVIQKKTVLAKSVKKPKKIQEIPSLKFKKDTATNDKKLCSDDCPMKCKKETCNCNTKPIKSTKTVQAKSLQQVYLNNHLTEITNLLQENLYYPRRARKRGIEGKVTMRFTLETNAEVSDIKIVASDKDILSRGAIRTLQSLSGKFPKPKEKLILTVPISYHLRH